MSAGFIAPLINAAHYSSRIREALEASLQRKVEFGEVHFAFFTGFGFSLEAVTIHEDPDYVEAAFSVGATGYVFKSRLATDLVLAVHGALQGQKFISVREKNTLRGDASMSQLKGHLALKRA